MNQLFMLSRFAVCDCAVMHTSYRRNFSGTVAPSTEKVFCRILTTEVLASDQLFAIWFRVPGGGFVATVVILIDIIRGLFGVTVVNNGTSMIVDNVSTSGVHIDGGVGSEMYAW